MNPKVCNIDGTKYFETNNPEAEIKEYSWILNHIQDKELFNFAKKQLDEFHTNKCPTCRTRILMMNNLLFSLDVIGNIKKDLDNKINESNKRFHKVENIVDDFKDKLGIKEEREMKDKYIIEHKARLEG